MFMSGVDRTAAMVGALLGGHFLAGIIFLAVLASSRMSGPGDA